MLAAVTYSLEALGEVVRELRLAGGLTQEDLGRAAEYGAGAAVSISRIERGLTRPGRDRFAGIAVALGLTPSQLEAEAEKRTGDLLQPVERSPNRTDEVRGSERTKDRVRRIQQEVERRKAAITELGDAYNEAHDRARDEFLLRFVGIATAIDGAPPPDKELVDEEDEPDAEGDAAVRLRYTSYGVSQALAGGVGGAAAGAAVGGAAAYSTFVATVSFGTASTGAAISGLSGVAANNAALALLGGGTLASGGAGVAGGTLLLTGLVAAPAAIFALSGLVWMARRNRKQQQELAEQLDQAESEMAATRRGFEALTDILPRATETLDYIAVHAGHALTRWEGGLGAGTSSWSSLAPDQQQRYQDFVEVTAAQLALEAINVQGLMATSDDEREKLIEFADDVLTQSRAVVESRV